MRFYFTNEFAGFSCDADLSIVARDAGVRADDIEVNDENEAFVDGVKIGEWR